MLGEAWRLVAGIDSDGNIFDFRWSTRKGIRRAGKPISRAEPWSCRVDGITVQSCADGEQAHRVAGALGFVDGPGFERHRNRIGLIGSGIPELAVDEDRYRHQGPFAVVAY